MNHCAAILVKEILITQIVLDAIANAELSVLQLAIPLQVCVGIASLRVKCRIVLVRVVTVQLQFFSSQNTQSKTYQLAATFDSKEGAHCLVPSAVGGLVVVSCALVAQDPAAIGDRHVGGHSAVRAPVVTIWVVADADGGLQAANWHFATTAHFFKANIMLPTHFDTNSIVTI